MTVFGFNSRRDAEKLSKLAKTMDFERGRPISAPNGLETILVKAPSGGINAKSSGQCSSAQCFVVHITEDGDVVDNTEEVEVWNFTEENVDAGAYISCFRFRTSWVFDGGAGGGGEAAPKRVKFKLNAPLYNYPVGTPGDDGTGAATVIDPMNSGLAIGDTIQVYDFQKQFEFTQADSIGIAVKSNFDNESVNLWHVEFCTQLVKRAKIDMSGDLTPWDGITATPSATFNQSMSDWPHVLWATSRDYRTEGGTGRDTVVEGVGQPVVNLVNPHKFAAASGWAIVERRPLEAVTQDPDNQTVPYNLTQVQDWEWHIVDVEKEVAQYARTKFLSGSFVLDAQGQDDYASGVKPTDMNAFQNGEPANPPDTIWAEFTDRICYVPSQTLGWAALNKNTGKYQTIMTLSAMFGKGEPVDAVANLKGEAGELIYSDPADECGEFRHKNLVNLIVFGDKSSNALCKLELDPSPDPVVDTFANASDIEVVTGVIINANGDLEMERSTIKACESSGTNQTIALTSMDVINDVYCSNNLLTKDYSTIKFLGSTVSSNTGVDLPCTNPANYNWETIFNNYVWNQNWWNVNYYDITFPYGCEPCETGCCTGGTYDGQEVTQYDCLTLGGGTSWSSSPCPTGCCTGGTYDGQDVTEYDCMTVGGGTSWSSSPCSSDCCCENVSVSQCDFGSPTSYTDGMGSSIGFTATNLVDNGDCTWTQSGNWSSNFDSSTPAGSYTLSYDDATCTWSISGTIPSPYGGTVSGSAVDCACDGTSTGSNILDIPISGTHASYMGSASYSGTVRINFTGTDCT